MRAIRALRDWLMQPAPRPAPMDWFIEFEQEIDMIPTIGRIVYYALSGQDADAINRRRTTGGSIAERIKVLAWPIGAQAHIGNTVAEGDTFPMLITRVWGSTPESAVNGQVFLDGNDVFWATSRTVGTQPGTFSWPQR